MRAGGPGSMPDSQLLREASAVQAQFQWEGLVPIVHHALRQLGEAPRAGVGVQVFRRTPPYPSGSREALLSANLVAVDERLKGLSSVRPGEQLWTMFLTLGCPDGRSGTLGRNACYFYHFDTPDPFTLRVTLQADNRYVISSVEEVRPPLWHGRGLDRPGITK